MTEHSDRARYVTEQVALWIVNDGDYFSDAVWQASDSVELMSSYLTAVLREARLGSAPWHVAQELAPNDYARIHWDDVAKQLLDE